jgi:hypothetical protein
MFLNLISVAWPKFHVRRGLAPNPALPVAQLPFERDAFAQCGDRCRGDVRPAKNFQKLLLGRGGFEQTVMPVDSAGDEER